MWAVRACPDRTTRTEMWTRLAISRSVKRLYWRRPPGEAPTTRRVGGLDPPCGKLYVLSSSYRVTSPSAAAARAKNYRRDRRADCGDEEQWMTCAPNKPWRRRRLAADIRRLDRRAAADAELVANYADIARVRSSSSSSMTAENWKRATTDGKPGVLNGSGSMNDRVAPLSINRFHRHRHDDNAPYIYYLRSVSSVLLRRITVDWYRALIGRLF